MWRILLRLLGITDFDTCKSCETLKSQLALVNEDRKLLSETLIRLIKPEVIHHNPATFIQPQAVNKLFTHRRADLERSHAAARNTKQDSQFIAKLPEEKLSNLAPVEQESVDDMEARLGLNEITSVKENASA